MCPSKLISLIVISVVVTSLPSMGSTSVFGNTWKKTKVPTNYPLNFYNVVRTSSHALCVVECQRDQFCTGFNFEKYSKICDLYVTLYPESNKTISVEDFSQSMFITTSGRGCIKNGYVMVRHLNTCIKRSKIKRNWSSASGICENNGARLMVVSTQEEFDLFYHPHFYKALKNKQCLTGRPLRQSLYQDFKTVFVGAKNNSTMWKWVDGTEVNWRTGHLSNPGESNCMDIRKDVNTNEIKDSYSDCDKVQNFMCEIKIIF